MNSSTHTADHNGNAPPPIARDAPSVNALAAPLVAQLLADATRLRIASSRHAFGPTIVDAGIATPGCVEAGVMIARICMGGLGRIETRISAEQEPLWPAMIEVHTASPVLACLGSQYAGWSLSASKEQNNGKKFFRSARDRRARWPARRRCSTS